MHRQDGNLPARKESPYMETYMETLSKKTTILLSPSLHDRLTRLAAERGTSLGDLVRRACEDHYGVPSEEERLAAVRALAALSLPVGTPAEMAAESVPDPNSPLP